MLLLSRHLRHGQNLSIQRLELILENLDLLLCSRPTLTGTLRSNQGLEVDPVESRPQRLHRSLDQAVDNAVSRGMIPRIRGVVQHTACIFLSACRRFGPLLGPAARVPNLASGDRTGAYHRSGECRQPSGSGWNAILWTAAPDLRADSRDLGQDPRPDGCVSIGSWRL